VSTPPRTPDPEPIPATTATLRDPRAEVTDRDFAGVVKTILDNNPGMEPKLAERIADEGIKFVVTAAANPALALAPSRVVDEGWHALILHTRTYQIVCTRNGTFAHHTPGYDPTFYDPEILERTKAAIEATGFEVDLDLWAGPLDGSIPVAANCQHAPECAIAPIPRPPGGGGS
jgi:hypothetical protein